MAKQSKTFCILPWLHSYINIDGRYQVCCIGDEFDSHIKTDTGEFFHILGNNSQEEIMNSTYMKEFRKKLLSGQWPEACFRCMSTEQTGGISRRQIELEQHREDIASALANTDQDGTIKVNTRHLDYRLGNACNLQCRMCNPLSSKRWINDYASMPEHISLPELREGLERFKKMDWFKSETYLKEFENKCENVTRIHFAGGEAFYVKQMVDLLKKCVEKDIAKNITLSYNTNMTILTNEILDLWTHFKEVKILASIDAFGKLNEYIRYPSQWKEIDENLRYLDENHQRFNISEVMISTTVQLNNVLHLDQLIKYLKTFQFIVPCPNVIPLLIPKYLSMNVLPKKLRFSAALKIENSLQNLSLAPEYQYLKANLQSIASQLLAAADEDPKLADEFIEFTHFYDKNKNLSLKEVDPILHQTFFKA